MTEHLNTTLKPGDIAEWWWLRLKPRELFNSGRRVRVLRPVRTHEYLVEVLDGPGTGIEYELQYEHLRGAPREGRGGMRC